MTARKAAALVRAQASRVVLPGEPGFVRTETGSLVEEIGIGTAIGGRAHGPLPSTVAIAWSEEFPASTPFDAKWWRR